MKRWLVIMPILHLLCAACGPSSDDDTSDDSSEALHHRHPWWDAGSASDAGSAFDAASDTGTVHHSVSLAWNASTTPGVTYDIYRSAGCTGQYVSQVAGLTVTTWTDTAVTSGQLYCYVTTAANANGESQYSNSARATIP